LSSDDLEKKLRLADEAWNKGDVEKALDYLTEALEKNPDNRDVVLKCGEILIALDQVEQAKDLYRGYLSKNLEDYEVKNILDRIEKHSKPSISDVSWRSPKEKSESTIKVSAIVSTYNSERFIRGCLEDLVNQTLYEKGGLEIVVVDSGSQQGERAIVEEFQRRYPNIVYIRTKERETVYAAWNRGIKVAKGVYITNANTDDRHRKDALEIMSNILDKRPEIGLVYADVIITEKENETFDNHTKTGVFQWFDYNREILAISCFVGPQPMWRKSLHDIYGYFDESFHSSGDWEFWLRISEGTKFLHIPEFLGLYLYSPHSAEHRDMDKRIKEDIEVYKRYIPKYLSKLEDVDRGLKFLQEYELRTRRRQPQVWQALFDIKSAIIEKQQIKSEGLSVDRNIYFETASISNKPTKKDLVSIIVFATRKDKIKRCLKSIKKNTMNTYEVIVLVDDDSSGYERLIKKIYKEGNFYRILNTGLSIKDVEGISVLNNSNLDKDVRVRIGFASSINKGISEASGEYIVVMTDDVVVSDGWLSGMLKCLNGLESSGFVGPMSNDAEKGQRIEGFEFKSIEHMNQFAREFMQKNKSRKIIKRKVDGFCMLFRRDLIDRIGLFDEQNFSGTYHFVDEDMCLRAVLEGYTNAIAGDVFVYRNQETNAEYIKSLNRIISDNRKMFSIKWSDAEELSPKWRKLLTANALSAAHDFVQKGIPENAVMVLLEAIKHSREDSRLHFSLVDTLIEKKKYIDAITILETMPDIFKEHPKRYEYLSICKEAVGNYEEAEIYADKALKYNGKSATSLNVKGLIAYKKGDVERAEDYFRKAIEIDDSYGEPYANVGAMKWSKGDKEEAFDYFVKACILSPTVEDIVMNLYNAGVRLTKLNVVEDAFRNAISAYPLNRRLRFLLIDVLMQEGKYVDAMEMLEDFMLDYGMDENTLKIAKSLRDKIGPKEVDKSSEDTISLCMIVKNEEKNIGGCLKKIKPLVDEMIVVDTGSTDMTKDIARAFGAKVHDFKWNNSFSDARNFSIDKASGKWILILDADEAIAPYDFKKLKRLVKETGSKLIAYSFVTRNYVQPMNTVGWVANDGSYIKEEAGTGWYMSEKVRLFPNDDRLRFERPVHELIEYSAIKHGIAIEKCDVPIHHYGKLDRAKVTEKGRDYYELGKIKLAEQGKKNLVAVFELAIQASELELHEEAVEHWKKAIELEPKFPKGYYGLGSSLFTLERYIEAYPALRKAVEMQPDDRDAVLMFSTCELFFGNAKVAIPLLERVLEKDPRFLRALLLIPVCYFCADMSEKGLEILNKLNTMKIDYAKYFIELSKKLYDLNRIPYAISTLNALKMGGYKDEYVDNTIEEYKKRLKEDLFKVKDSRPEISLCMIVKDEEKNIIRCLTAVKPLVDEMIVVDTGSKDNTKKIAQSLGAKVFDFQWSENFSDARNFSIEKASGKWILVIDADEVISPVDFEFIKNLVRHADERKYAFSLITRNYVNQVNTMGWQPNDGKYIEEAGAGWYYGEKVRLFPNIEGVRFEDPVHERVEPSLEKIGISIIDTYIPVHHYGELDVSKVKAKDELYYELGKQRLAEKGGRDVKALYDLGVQASRLERYEEAIEFFNEVIGLDPDYVKAFESMGNAYYNKGDYEKAKEYYKKVIDKGDPSREVVVMSANCEIFTGNSERAIEVLQRLIEKEPTYPLAMFVYCIAFFTAGLKEKGMGLLSTLKGMNIFALRDFIGYARILISLNRYDYALRILKPLKDMEISSEELDELLGVCKKNMIGG